MEQSITFVDVETPNYQNNSISSIGVINVDGDGCCKQLNIFLLIPRHILTVSI